MNKTELFDYCSKLSKKNNIEFYFEDNTLQQNSIEMFSISKSENKIEQALLIKVIINGQIGEYTITKFNKKDILLGIQKAKNIAKLKTDFKIKEFGNQKSKKKIRQDKELNNINFSELLDELKSNIKREKYIKSYEGNIRKSKHYKFYTNPYFETEEESYSISLGLNINTKDKKQSSGGFSNIFTKCNDIDIYNTIEQAKINAFNLLNPTQGIKDKYTLIFIPEIVEEIFSELILPATIGESIFKKESYLYRFKNKDFLSKNTIISEQPHIDYFTGSQVIDNEGYKTKKKKIIDKGEFKKEIYDVHGALISNKKSTGNGFRNSAYSSISCDFTNIIQEKGKHKIDNIISKTKKGILVYGLMGFHTSNLTNGDFSLTINQGKEIIDGNFKNTITNLNFTGNCKNSFKNLKLSKEQMFFGNSLYSFGSINNIKLI